MSNLLRLLTILALALIVHRVHGQRIDSVHVFVEIPRVKYTSASAEAMGWRLHHARAPYTSISSTDLDGLNTALKTRKLEKHVQAELPGLGHLGLAYSNGGIHIFGLMEDMDLMVDLTKRRQLVIDDWSERMALRALMLSL